MMWGMCILLKTMGAIRMMRSMTRKIHVGEVTKGTMALQRYYFHRKCKKEKEKRGFGMKIRLPFFIFFPFRITFALA